MHFQTYALPCFVPTYMPLPFPVSPPPLTGPSPSLTNITLCGFMSQVCKYACLNVDSSHDAKQAAFYVSCLSCLYPLVSPSLSLPLPFTPTHSCPSFSLFPPQSVTFYCLFIDRVSAPKVAWNLTMWLRLALNSCPVLLPQPRKCWDARVEPPCLIFKCFPLEAV